MLATIMGMNPKESFGNISQQAAGCYIPAYTGQFDLQSSVHYVSEAWVSLPSALRDKL